MQQRDRRGAVGSFYEGEVLRQLCEPMSTSARSMGFDYFGATMGRTGWPILIHYAIGDSA